ncbi:MAG: hypothetical protein QW232_04020 [Saccharolobus sp.]
MVKYLGTSLLIAAIVTIGIVASIFYLQNADINISVKPIFWRIYQNYNNTIGVLVSATNNALLAQNLNVTIIIFYNPYGNVIKTITNSTTLVINPHMTVSRILYLAFNTKDSPTPIIPEFTKVVVKINGLYGYYREINLYNDLYLKALTPNGLLLLANNGGNQFPILKLIGSFTPTAPFNYTDTLLYYQYNYTTNTTSLVSQFSISPFAYSKQYLTPGLYNITFEFLNHTTTFTVNIKSNSKISFYLISPPVNYNLTVILKGPETYYGTFSITI